MSQEYVSLDLETTGLDPENDAIIEVAAVRFRGSRVIEEFSSLVAPGRPVPNRILELTGITSQELARAPQLWEVLRRLRQFVGERPIVGHSIGFDVSFLARHQLFLANRKIDTFELSTILLPHVARHSLEHLTNALDLAEPGRYHRALPDARAAMNLFLALRKAASSLPLPVLEEIVLLARRSGWQQGEFFADVLDELKRRPNYRSIGQQLSARLAEVSFLALAGAQPVAPTKPLQPRRPFLPVSEQEVLAGLAARGPIANALPEFEERPQQLEMAQAICQAFNEGRHLIVEAGTGVGKSLAYLLPAVQFAQRNRARVVISTHTINLQEQLYNKDLPLIAKALGTPIRSCVLKGRNNYLCMVRFRAMLARPNLSPQQAFALAKVVAWLPSTTTGDRSELFLNTFVERLIWEQICSDSYTCLGERCPERAAGRCYYARAHALAEECELVIVNHALLVLDALAGGGAIPPYEHLIVDEAHHLEGACTKALQVELVPAQLQESILTVYSAASDGEAGALAALRAVLRPLKHSSLLAHSDQVAQLLTELPPLLAMLAAAISSCAEALLPNASTQRNGGPEHRRITARERRSSEWQALVAAWFPVGERLKAALAKLQQLTAAALEAPTAEDERLSEAAATLIAAARALAEQASAFSEVIAEPRPDRVYWLTRRGEAGLPVLCAAPLSVAEALGTALFARKRVAILTSATLAVGGSFEYCARSLGLSDYAELLLGSPFDYRRSTLVCIATDVPEPRQPGNQKAVEEAIAQLARALGGRMLVLFTSHSQLQRTAAALRPELEQEHIVLYCQNEGSSRSQLLESFRNSERAVLFGTRSFWEGIDLRGEALQCLVMVKLPFLVPDDPIVAAKSEQYPDPFKQYHLPEAVLTFRQGFGRLIRSHTDRGAFVVLDSRLASREYGAVFSRALPDCTLYAGPVGQIVPRVAAWLRAQVPAP